MQGHPGPPGRGRPGRQGPPGPQGRPGTPDPSKNHHDNSCPRVKISKYHPVS